MTGFSCLVCLFHLTFEIPISVPVSVLGTVSVALGLLLAFRVNTAYDRYWEGRKLIQTVTATIRNVARQVWINIPEETEQDHLEKMRCVKLLLAFFVATKHHLRHEYGTNYYDLEVLLPPKWEPASSAKRNQAQTLQGQNTRKTTTMNIKLNDTAELATGSSTSVDGHTSPKKRREFHILDKAPAIVVSLTDSIKPKQHGCYMESDDPTSISNVRRSLIQQEFPNSDFVQASTAQIKSSMTGADLEQTISDEEEQQVSRLLDEAVNLPPTSAVPDSPRPDGNRADSRFKNATLAKMGSHTQADLHSIKHRIRNQHQKFRKRRLDHSEFTSEEDLPYQGDSDLSLPLEILFRVALYINQAKAANKIESTLVSVTTSSIDILVNSLTAFERIVHTPIPKAYNIHLKQAVVLYIFFLPFALVDSLAWIVAPVVALVSFTLFGIEAIGAEIENPFGYDDNDLPLNRYCDELKKEVEYIIYHIPTQSTSILLDGQ
ncbi:Bestrophin, RFP-TM, chloride channel-domain-containing protein [Parasitella parasitica]|nr:Bestrophin, RFP-TM, chloride channel-domain-containing protein [Parasitella parasitica]